MQPKHLQRLIDWLLASVWLIMGLYCKVLGQVPRHEAIVGEILGVDAALWLTPLRLCRLWNGAFNVEF